MSVNVDDEIFYCLFRCFVVDLLLDFVYVVVEAVF